MVYNSDRMRIVYLLLTLLVLVPLGVAQPAEQSNASEDLQKAHSELEHDNAEAAFGILSRLASAQPPIKGTSRELGLAYYRTGQLDKAKQSFEKAMDEDPEDRDAIQMEGLVLYRMGQQSAAIPYLERVRQWMPDANTDANYIIGLCYLKAHRYDDARASFAAQFGLKDSSASAYLLLGNMLRQFHEPDDGAEQVRKALKLSPNLPLAHFMLGELAMSKSDNDLAIKEFEAERDVNPTYAPIYDRLGGVYLSVDKVEKAQQALINSIALDRTNTEAFVKMGKVLLAKQDFGTAVMYLKVAAKMDNDNFVTHELLSQAYHRVGREEDAKQEAATADLLHANSLPKVEPSKE